MRTFTFGFAVLALAFVSQTSFAKPDAGKPEAVVCKQPGVVNTIALLPGYYVRESQPSMNDLMYLVPTEDNCSMSFSQVSSNHFIKGIAAQSKDRTFAATLEAVDVDIELKGSAGKTKVTRLNTYFGEDEKTAADYLVTLTSATSLVRYFKDGPKTFVHSSTVDWAELRKNNPAQ
jgi:hypothetical protein